MDNQANTKSNLASSSVLQEIREVLARITPGDWHQGPHYRSDVESRHGRICETTPLNTPQAIANAEAIAALPRLLRHAQAEIEGLQQKEQALKIAVANAVKTLEAAEARAEAAEGKLRLLEHPWCVACANGDHQQCLGGSCLCIHAKTASPVRDAGEGEQA